MERADAVKLIRLDCGKANAIDGRLLEILRSELDEAKENGARAVVITGYDKYFSAGLNLKSLPDSSQGMLDFAEQFDRELIHLWSYPLPVVAAINGHAVAGGCVLACACDVRLGAEGRFQIGLTETDVGVPFPSAALTFVRQAIHRSWVTDVVLGARLLSPAEAVESGILHATLEPEKLLPEAMERAAHLGSKPQPAFGLTKRALLDDLLSHIEATATQARESFVDCWFSESVRKQREAMLRR